MILIYDLNLTLKVNAKFRSHFFIKFEKIWSMSFESNLMFNLNARTILEFNSLGILLLRLLD